MAIKDKIFKLFGSYEKRLDSNKDSNGKGTLERYMEAYGDDIDTNIIPLIENLVQNLFDPERLLTRFIDYNEHAKGVGSLFLTVNSSQPNAQAQMEWMRRRILKHIEKFHLIKGTQLCYKLLIRLFDPSVQTVTITEYFKENRYDSNKEYDNNYNYDTSICAECPEYSIDIATQNTSSMPTADFIKSLKTIISYNHPIDCKIRYIKYNATLIPL